LYVVERDAENVSVGKYEGKSSLGRPRRIWGDNIKMIFKKQDGGTLTALIRLTTGTSGVLL
jgi:hypothetical protein